MPEEIKEPTMPEPKMPGATPSSLTPTPAVKENPYPPPPPAKEPKQAGFLERFWYLFVILAILCLIGIGGLWFLNQRKLSQTPSLPTPTPTETVDQTTQELKEQGKSDEIDEIEADLKSTNLTNLDQELEDIEKELTSE
jgi:uncharacterized protein HemX